MTNSSPKMLFNDKILDCMATAVNKAVRLLVLEGTIRSSKTVVAIQSFFYRVFESKGLLHLIAGRDFDTIKNNILEAGGFGLIRLFDEYCQLKRDEIGGYYVSMISPNGIKKIMLVGYSDKRKWTKILGNSIECIFIDEVNIADKQFIEECFARQVSFENMFTIWTLNGDTPTHFIYTDYINRCKVLGNAPASILTDMAKCEKAKGWYYMHFKMNDNPAMTPSKIAYASSIYPAGSYYYTIKILGERGTPGKMIFLDYMNDKLIQSVDLRKYTKYGIGVDIGATRAKNSFTLCGFTPSYSEIAVVEKESFSEVGYKEKTERLKRFVREQLNKQIYIEYVSVDSAEQNYIEDLRNEFKKEGLPDIIPSYKATIKERIDMLIVLMATGRIVFNKDSQGAMNVYDAYRISSWTDGKEGIERLDNNEWQNDIMDSCEYALTRHMKAILRA